MLVSKYKRRAYEVVIDSDSRLSLGCTKGNVEIDEDASFALSRAFLTEKDVVMRYVAVKNPHVAANQFLMGYGQGQDVVNGWVLGTYQPKRRA
jgi:hypothetical protein